MAECLVDVGEEGEEEEDGEDNGGGDGRTVAPLVGWVSEGDAVTHVGGWLDAVRRSRLNVTNEDRRMAREDRWEDGRSW
jgi:hypothetical protein